MTARPGIRLRALLLLVLLTGSADAGESAMGDTMATACRGIWLCAEEARLLPMEGPAWIALARAAAAPMEPPRIADQNDNTDVHVLAKALVYARTGDSALHRAVIDASMAAMGSEAGGDSLALGRNLIGYVIAADIVGLPPEQDAAFRTWLTRVVNTPMGDRTLRHTHEWRPNNWGTHAGASRLAVALYLDDRREVERIAAVFHGWLGDRTAYRGFRFRERDWQAAPDEPVAVNPAGAERDGHSIDGVLPDDQRRCCDGFAWPPPKEPYVYEALQGALAQAVMLHRAGYAVWEWQDRALLRAFRWLYETADFPAAGDDTWQPYVINHYYCAGLPVVSPARPGKNLGYTDWTHPPCGTMQKRQAGTP